MINTNLTQTNQEINVETLVNPQTRDERFAVALATAQELAAPLAAKSKTAPAAAVESAVAVAATIKAGLLKPEAAAKALLRQGIKNRVAFATRSGMTAGQAIYQAGRLMEEATRAAEELI